MAAQHNKKWQAENEKQKRHNDEVLYIFSYNALCDKRNRDNEDEATITFF